VEENCVNQYVDYTKKILSSVVLKSGEFLRMNPVNSVKQKIGSTTLWLHLWIISYTDAAY
jgi:hypothetical protein